MPGDFGQFAGQCLGGDDRARLGRFAIEPTTAILVVLPGKISRFHKSPGQIPVATFAIVLPLFLVVGYSPRIDRPAITGKLSWRFKAADLAYFQSNGHPQDATYSRQAQQFFIAGHFSST